jgi:hypothetical protein
MNGKIPGTSVIAYAVVAFVASLCSFYGGIVTCNLGAIFLCILGSAVRKGSWRACPFAIFFSAIDFISATANVVAGAKFGIIEVGEWTFCTALVFAPWALLNMALLAQFRNVQRRIKEQGDQFPPAVADSPPHPLQFSLRSMFVLTILVALACALGTRPPATNDSWNISWASPGKSGLWHVEVVGYHSGKPAVGYLWQTMGTQGADPAGRIRVSAVCSSAEPRHYIKVDGVAIQPSEEFQLFVNDLHGDPMRLVIPRKDAMEVFGRQLNASRIEKFWNEVVEPQRRNPATARPTP